MEKHCNYCGQSDTKLDRMGYCVKYACWERSGAKDELEPFKERMRAVYRMPDTWGQVGRIVSNPYSHRHREVDSILASARLKFGGFVPLELLELVPMQYKGKRWDHSIRW